MSPIADEQAWREAGPEICRFWQLATDNVWRGDTIAPESLPKYTERYAYFPGGLTRAENERVGHLADRQPGNSSARKRAR